MTIILYLIRRGSFIAFDQNGPESSVPTRHSRFYPRLPLILPCYGLGHEKFFKAHIPVKPPPPAVLDAAVWKNWLIMDRHAVNMYSAMILISSCL